jgi:ABC-type transporter Mla subunit MlaD
MHVARTADIIPFPSRKAAENSDSDRLTTALSALDIALAEQRAAIAAWRESLTELRGVMGNLGTGLTEYRDSLTNLGGKVQSLRSDAAAMEEWADAVLAQKD